MGLMEYLEVNKLRKETKKRLLSVFCVLLLIMSIMVGYEPQQASAHHNGTPVIGATPPMGYSTWNAVRFNVSDQLIRDISDSMARTGLKDLGYVYVNIDDGWQGGRDSNGNIYPDSARFPHGMKALADYVHSLGLKIGIYTDIGLIGCGGRVGSYGYYQQDVNLFAEWGFDYIKVDACGADTQGLDFKTQYIEFHQALKNATPYRDIFLNVCEWGQQQPWNWAPEFANTWRVGYDIDNQGDYWDGVLYEIDQAAPHWNVAGPGHFNDPDSLEVGVISDRPGKSGLNYTESVSNFSMWAILSAPLMLGLDVTALDQPGSYSSQFADIIMNAEVIAIDQDPAGIQGRKVNESFPGLQVYSKPLGSQTSGERAVVLLNRTNQPATMTVTADQIGLKESFEVRDLWEHEDKGTYVYSYSDTVPAHGSVMLKITGTYDATQPIELEKVRYEAEDSQNTFGGAGRVMNHNNASGRQVAGWIGNGSANYVQFNQIEVPSSGTYEVTFGYMTGTTRYADMYVNDRYVSRLAFSSSGGWNTVGELTFEVDLKAGVNTLKLTNHNLNDYAPDIDYIEVTELPIIYEVTEGKSISTDSEHPEHPASLAIDGLYATKWKAADLSSNHSVTVDLGGKHFIHASSIAFEHIDKAYKYIIQTKESEEDDWVTVIDQSGNTTATSITKHRLYRTAAYVKVTITGLPDTNTSASIAELSLFGKALSGNIEEDIQSTLTGPTQVAPEQMFTVKLGLDHVTSPWMAGDVEISYDSDLFEFSGSESILEGFQVLKQSEEILGKIRLITASLGNDFAISSNVDFVSLTFLTKEGTNSQNGTISVDRITLGSSDGTESEALVSELDIEVQSGLTGNPDVNEDGKVSIGDLALIAVHYGKNYNSLDWQQIKHLDIVVDQEINLIDLVAVASLIVNDE